MVKLSCFLFFHCRTITWQALVPLVPSSTSSFLFLSTICHTFSSVINFPTFAPLSLHTLFSTLFFAFYFITTRLLSSLCSIELVNFLHRVFCILLLCAHFVSLAFQLCVLQLPRSLSMFRNQQITFKIKIKIQVLFWVVAFWIVYHKLHKGIFISFIFYSSYSFTLF